MVKNRRTSAPIAKTASKLLRTSKSSPVKKVSASALSQRAPKNK